MAAENELCRLLAERLDMPVSRSLESPRGGGADILDIPPLAIEVKRSETLAIAAWWEQAVEQALQELPTRIPILFYRQNMKPWICVAPIVFINPHLNYRVFQSCFNIKTAMDFDSFCDIYKLIWKGEK